MPSLGRWGNQWNDRYSKNERTNDVLYVCVRERSWRGKSASQMKPYNLPSQNYGHGSMRCNMCHGIGNLIKTLVNVGGDGKHITNIAESLWKTKREQVSA